MKHGFLRRFGALTLALALALTLAVTPAWADDPGDPGTTPTLIITKDGGGAVPTELKVGESVTLEASPSDSTITGSAYEWTAGGTDKVELSGTNTKTVTVTAKSAGDVTLTVTLTGASGPTNSTSPLTASCSLKIVPADPPPADVKVTSITLSETTKTLKAGGTFQLTPTIAPADATNKAVTWSNGGSEAATVDANGVVTARNVGTATITATAADGSGVTATCKVTVVAADKPAATKIEFMPPAEKLAKGDTKNVSLAVTPVDGEVASVEWTSDNEKIVTVSGGGNNPLSATIKGVSPGTATVTAKAGESDALTAKLTVTVSGIALSCPNNDTMTGEAVTLVKNQKDTLVATLYGDAKGGTVTWECDKRAVADVSATGVVTAKAVGTATITVKAKSADGKQTFTSKCTVTVTEDTATLINLGSVGAGNEVSLSGIVTELGYIAARKGMTGVDYVTGLSVPTNQGILHYNYLYEGDTGAGVGSEKYYLTYRNGQKELSRMSFVPRADFSGTADINYTAWKGNDSFSGIIRVTVNAAGDVSYSTAAGTPVTFRAGDFSTACRNRTGRELSYVTFTLPQSTAGELRLNYVGAAQPGQQISSSTKVYRNGSPSLDSLTFIPAQSCPGTVRISYRAVDTGNVSYTGYVTITVGSGGNNYNPSDVRYSVAQGQQVIFQASDFNNACWAAINEPLAYVRFSQVSASQGSLYYNYRGSGGYDSYVNAYTNYYQNGSPSIGGISFVPSAASGQAAFSYTGYGTGGTTYTGVVYIDIGGTSQRGVQYNTFSGKLVNFSAYDFVNACSSAAGGTLNYIQFSSLPNSNEGTLYYNYNSSTSWNTQASTWTYYYRTTSYSGQNLIGGLSFLANKNFTGTVQIPFTGYNTNNVRFEGVVTIQVSAPTPNDVNLSTSPSTPVRLSSSTLRSVCNAVLDQELSYIQLTSLPNSAAGQLYSNYNGAGSGTQAVTGTRYYRSGTPSIDQLTFVPRNGYQGSVTIGYTGVSVGGQQVSGRINIQVSSSTSSRYFSDMGAYRWAVDAVDYLYQNGVIEGMGNGTFAPGQSIRRCDFVLMLCRAFNLTGESGYSFADVPVNSYYGPAVATAKRLGIVSGDGASFWPSKNLSRQDAMVMLNNTLKATGHNLSNGLTADLEKFVDHQQISGYARSSVGILVHLGAVQGDGNGRLRPWGTINRAEAAKLIQFIMAM